MPAPEIAGGTGAAIFFLWENPVEAFCLTARAVTLTIAGFKKDLNSKIHLPTFAW